MLRDGGGAMLARNEHGEAVGTAQFPAPQAGVTEISGVGVLAQSRRRGIGAALTWHVLELAFASGVEVAWLSPEDDDVERIYVRSGFSRVCDALHLHASDADESGEAGGGGLEPPTSGSKGRRSAD
jgi:N-acetylglutamate synthase-like GNAT family acetyltransferase